MYCGNMFLGQPDIYGRRFLVLLPKDTKIAKCEVHVTGHGGDMKVAAGSKTGVLKGTKSDKTIVYDCAAEVKAETPYTIISNIDVFVIVIFTNKNGAVGTYQVFPVDAVGKEMLGITDNSLYIQCFLTAIDYLTDVTVFKTQDKEWTSQQPPCVDGSTFQLAAGQAKKIETNSDNVFKGILFKANRPIYMFCGESLTDNKTAFYQIPPTSSLGKEYVTPAFNPVIVDRPFDASLRIQADSDNTIVFIKGDFDAVIVIYKRGR